MKKESPVLYVYVGSAGIGRMHFGAWLGDEKIDRSDGSDDDVYVSLADALAAAGRRLEEKIGRTFWTGEAFKPTPLLSGTAAKKHRDVLAVRITRGFIDRFEAEWMGVDDKGYCDPDSDEREAKGGGRTIALALRDLGEKTQNELAHNAWVMRFT